MDFDLVTKGLKPTEEYEPHWWKLKWGFIKNGTYNIFIKGGHSWDAKLFGIRFWRSSAHNGWGRGWDGFAVEIGFWWTLDFWLHYNFKVNDEFFPIVKEHLTGKEK